MQRRQFLALLGAGVSSSVISPVFAEGGIGADFEQIDLHLPGEDAPAHRALVLVPKHLDPAQQHPAVVLLHGYAQAAHELTAIHAWRDDYAALRNARRLRNPPVERLYQSVRYLDDRRIREINGSLEREPYRGLVMICPAVPIPYFCRDAGKLFDEYAAWIGDTLLPLARTRAPISADPARVGLAGHSMGGHFALEVFLRKPELFGSLSAIQPELQKNAGWRYARRIASRMQELGKKPLQVLTSTRDHYRHEVRVLHGELARRGVEHAFRAPFGPHASSWMREVGTLETLLWQDRVLRGLALEPAPRPGHPRHGEPAVESVAAVPLPPHADSQV